MELMLTIIAWIIQCLPIVIVAGVVAVMLGKLLHKKRRRMVSFLACMLVECILLACLAQDPIVICPDKYSGYVSDADRENIASVHRGLYSKRLPLIPCVIEVKSANNTKIVVRTYYLFWGVRELEFGESEIGPGQWIFPAIGW